MGEAVKVMVRVSILTPVYNVKQYLGQCLDSLAAQTLDDIEFLCIDDGSTDGSEKILDAYAAKDKRFRVIHKANSGYGATMNVGLRAAQGKYIGILESDDYVDKEMFQTLYEAAEHTQAEVVKSNYWMFQDATGDIFQEMMEGCPYQTLCSVRTVPRLLQTNTFVWTALYRKDFLQSYAIWFQETPGASYQDVAFSLKAALCCKKMWLLKDAYLHYRRDNVGASSFQTAKKIHCYHDEFAEYWHFLSLQSPDLQRIGSAASYNMWRIYSSSCWPFVARSKRVDYLKKVISEFRSLEAKGMLKETEWPADIWHKLMALLHQESRQLFYCTMQAEEEAWLEKGFLDVLRHGGNFYLYGAGQVAGRLMQYFQKNAIAVQGIIVSERHKRVEDFYGAPVYDADDTPADPEKDVVVIATSPSNLEVQQEIYQQLQAHQYRHIIVLTEGLKKAINI